MLEYIIENKDYPNNFLLNQVADIDVETVWALQELAIKHNKGLIANVTDQITKGFLEDRGFSIGNITQFGEITIRSYSGNPIVSVEELDVDLKAELLTLTKDHHQRVYRVNPPAQDLNYETKIFKHPRFDAKNSIVRLEKQHVIAAILLLKENDDFILAATFADDVLSLIDLWHDLFGILPIGSIVKAEFLDSDPMAKAICNEFNWYVDINKQYTMVWEGKRDSLR